MAPRTDRLSTICKTAAEKSVEQLRASVSQGEGGTARVVGQGTA